MNHIEEIVTLSKAMSDSNRIKIITLIQREGGLCVCEICDTLHLSQPLVSRHLKQLKNSYILSSHKEGKWVIYTITEKPSLLLNQYLKEMKPLEKELPEVVSCSIR